MGFLTNDDAPVIWRGPMLHGVDPAVLPRRALARPRLPDRRHAAGHRRRRAQPEPVGAGVGRGARDDAADGVARRHAPRRADVPEAQHPDARPDREHEPLRVPRLRPTRADLFGKGGGEALATELNVPFLGRIPLYEPVRVGGDTGVPIVIGEPDSAPARAHRRGRRARRGAGVDRAATRGRIPLTPGALMSAVACMEIAFTKTTLANGLDVIVHEDHALPLVAVNVWYHVGSKNERPGLTGFAHLFEHLMFEGSANHDSGYFAPLQDAGARGQRLDQRRSHQLLGGRADRRARARALAGIRSHGVPAAGADRGEVRRPSATSCSTSGGRTTRTGPYGLAGIAMATAALSGAIIRITGRRSATRPTCAPRRSTTSASSSRATTIPANASLALAGDIDPARALALVERYFGDLPAGPPRARGAGAGRRRSPASGGSCSRIASSCRGSTSRGGRRRCSPRATRSSTSSPTCSPAGRRRGSIARWFTSGGSRSTSRRRSRRASSTACSRSSRPPRPGARSPSSRRSSTSRPRRARGRRPDRRRAGARAAQAEAKFVYRLQTVGGFGGKSDQLNAYNVYRGNPGSFDADLARYMRLTPADVRDAARRLVASPHVALSVVPTGASDQALAGSETAVAS